MLPPTSSSNTPNTSNATSGIESNSTAAPASNNVQTTLTQQGVYPPQFASNYMVGNVGMLDANVRTWFGTQLLYVHLINFLPVTTATGELFTKMYASREYESVLKSLEAEPAWIGYVIANHAISNPNAAWKEAQSVSSPTLDPALSKSQLLYWIATRKGFSVSNLPSPGTIGASNSTTHANISSTNSKSSSCTCSTNPKCSALGLMGACCPTGTGTFLDCCER